MSAYADTLPESERPAYAEGTTLAGRNLAAALADMTELARTQGPRAVAEAAHPGGKSVEELEAEWHALVAAARMSQAA